MHGYTQRMDDSPPPPPARTSTLAFLAHMRVIPPTLMNVFLGIKGNDYGATFWQWAPDQSSPHL
ncbi:MAG: hypothetical protein P8Y78_03960 [Acidihalobacter sp.]|jgi:hypothetical protein